MDEPETKTQYRDDFKARVKAARVARALKQWEIADALDMSQDQYKQYETRSLLPHHLISRFCTICHINPTWLITGHGPKAAQLPEPAPDGPTQISQPKRARKSRAA